MTDSYVVIGDGIAGATAAETLREEDGEADVTVLTDEPEPLYNRIMLKSYMKGDLPATKFTKMHDQGWYDKRDINLELETEVVDVDTSGKTVETAEGETYSYDRLLVATGGSPRKFPADEGYENIYYMWSMDSAEALKERAGESEKAVVIGGGLLGIDLAVALSANGAEVDYLIRGENWWHRGLDAEGAELVHERLEKKGVNVVTGTEVDDFEVGDGRVTAAIAGDRRFECDTVAVAIGQEPNASFIDVEKNDAGMIKTDKHLQTSDESVYAAGNMVEYDSPVFERRLSNGSWDHSEAMGETAALNMLGDREEFDYVNTYGVGHFDIQFLAVGDWGGEPVSRRYSDSEYRRLFFREGRLVGAVLVGYTGGQEAIRKAISRKESFEDREKLLEKGYWQS
ncbi:MAG: NAD(P)/FAD-dependent oxidoreductase [Candidatus Nanohaloarchaea archaeon]